MRSGLPPHSYIDNTPAGKTFRLNFSIEQSIERAGRAAGGETAALPARIQFIAPLGRVPI
jgi:hypothetical protein